MQRSPLKLPDKSTVYRNTIDSHSQARDQAAWHVARMPGGSSLAEAEKFCRQIAKSHYENFSVCTCLVPKRLRQDFANIYAFSRWSDDLGDESESSTEATEKLHQWRNQLRQCFHGEACHPIFIALRSTIDRTRLSIEPFDDLVDAFCQDQVCRVYTTRVQLFDYCRRSANPVGRIVLGLEQCFDSQLIALSDQICTGLQLINFWQDIARDFTAGRIYLPEEDRLRWGVSIEELGAKSGSIHFRNMVKEQVQCVREMFDEGQALVREAPRSLRPAIGLFLAGGRAVADGIERIQFDTLATRPVVSRIRKLSFVFQALCFRGVEGMIEPMRRIFSKQRR